MNRGFTSTLNYTSVNEDWRTEAAALRPGPGDVVLAISGAGRPLDLLALDAARVVAIDVAPAQNALLELEAAAIAALPFDDYVRLLGLVEGDPRWRLDRLAELEGAMSRRAVTFWRDHRRLVEAGVLYQGRWERFFRILSRIARAARPRTIRTLMEFTELEAQRQFVAERWDRPWWRAMYQAALCRPVLRLLYRDPGFYAHADVRAATHVYARMRASLGRVLARDSFMLSLVLTGRLAATDLPPRLTREGCARIRARLDRLEILTSDVVDHLERGDASGAFSCFSLSDVPSYLSQPAFERLLAGLERCATPGARFCIRLFLSRPRFPDRAARLVRDPGLEARLALEDHAFAYDFITGHVAA